MERNSNGGTFLRNETTVSVITDSDDATARPQIGKGSLMVGGRVGESQSRRELTGREFFRNPFVS
jgi:hypothetical protein